MKVLTHKFVEFIPDQLEEGILYISIPYATVVHKCCCGCGMEVVTPLTPTDWKLTFDGESVSLNPSVGNWSIPCRSHYVIKNNRIHWATDWSSEQISEGRKTDKLKKDRYFKTREPSKVENEKLDSENPKSRMSLFDRLTKYFKK